MKKKGTTKTYWFFVYSFSDGRGLSGTGDTTIAYAEKYFPFWKAKMEIEQSLLLDGKPGRLTVVITNFIRISKRAYDAHKKHCDQKAV